MQQRNATRIENQPALVRLCKNGAFRHQPLLRVVPIIVALDYPETMTVGRVLMCDGTGFDKGTLYCRAAYGEPQKFRNWPDGLTDMAFYVLAKAGPCFWREFAFNFERKPDGSWRNLAGVPVPNNPFKPLLARLDGPEAAVVEAEIVEGVFGEQLGL